MYIVVYIFDPKKGEHTANPSLGPSIKVQRGSRDLIFFLCPPFPLMSTSPVTHLWIQSFFFFLQAIQQVQGTLKEQRKQADSRSSGVTGARPPAPRAPAPRQAAPATVPARPAPRASVTRQSTPNLRQVTPVARQAAPQQVVPRAQQAAPKARQVTPSPRQPNPSPRQGGPKPAAPRAVAPRATTPAVVRPQGLTSQGLGAAAQHTQLPAFLTGQVN